MGLTKTYHFSEQQNKTARIAKALAHPARIAILELLRNADCICSEIVEEVPLSQSTISQHLKELKQAGLIKGEISGPRTCYCIDQETWKEAEQMFQSFFGAYDQATNCC